MNKQREALQMAINALDKYAFSSFIKESDWRDFQKIMSVLREALVESEPWTPDDMAYRPGGLSMDLPPARKPLTDDEIDALDLPPNGCTIRELVRAIERAHGIDGGHDCWR